MTTVCHRRAGLSAALSCPGAGARWPSRCEPRARYPATGHSGSWMATPNHVFVHGTSGDSALVARLLAAHRPDAVVHFARKATRPLLVVRPASSRQGRRPGVAAAVLTLGTSWQARRAVPFLLFPLTNSCGSPCEPGLFREPRPTTTRTRVFGVESTSDHLSRVPTTPRCRCDHQLPQQLRVPSPKASPDGDPRR